LFQQEWIRQVYPENLSQVARLLCRLLPLKIWDLFQVYTDSTYHLCSLCFYNTLLLITDLLVCL